MNSRIVILAAAVVVLLAAGVYVFTQSNTGSTQSVTTNTTQDSREMNDGSSNTGPAVSEMNESTESGQATTDETSTVKEVTVTTSNFKFTPATITVNKGDTVHLTLVNAAGTHDFVLDEFNAKTKVLGPGQQETIEFVADEAGEFEYYCSVGTHRQMGMVGKLIVK